MISAVNGSGDLARNFIKAAGEPMSQQPPPGQGPVSMPGGSPQQPGYPPSPMLPIWPPAMMPYPPMQPPRQGGGFARAIFTTLATTIFGFSLLLNIWLFSASALTSSAGRVGGTVERVLAPGDLKSRVAVVRLSGVIEEGSKERFLKMLDRARTDPTVKALVLEIDSPGGGVTPSDEIYDAILDLKREKNIKVFASFQSLAASGGYYVACAADEIYAQRTTLTGSIGVLFSRFDVSEFADKYGIKDGTIVSDGATFKDAGSSMKPMTPEQTAYFKTILNDAFGTFKSVVTTGRGDRLKVPVETVADGKIFSAAQAKAFGLIDGDQLYLKDVIARATQSIGVANPSIFRIEHEPSLLEQLGGQPAAKFGGEGASVKIDSSLIHDMLTPRLMYLWPGS